MNMLPSDNVYLPTALGANDEYATLGWQIRVVAVRMEEPGALDVALVLPGDGPGGLREDLEALPGPSEVLEVVQRRMAVFGHSLNPVYFSDAMWRDASESPEWRYND